VYAVHSGRRSDGEHDLAGGGVPDLYLASLIARDNCFPLGDQVACQMSSE
jgi:hypothetical protein